MGWVELGRVAVRQTLVMNAVSLSTFLLLPNPISSLLTSVAQIFPSSPYLTPPLRLWKMDGVGGWGQTGTLPLPPSHHPLQITHILQMAATYNKLKRAYLHQLRPQTGDGGAEERKVWQWKYVDFIRTLANISTNPCANLLERLVFVVFVATLVEKKLAELMEGPAVGVGVGGGCSVGVRCLWRCLLLIVCHNGHLALRLQMPRLVSSRFYLFFKDSSSAQPPHLAGSLKPTPTC